MKSFILLVVGTLIFVACHKDNPPENPVEPPHPEPEQDTCDIYASGIYKDSLPGNIPSMFWYCMSTDTLVNAISYNFPSLYMLTGGCCGLQSGYDLCKRRYEWYNELENRADAISYLIEKYASIDTLTYDLSLDPIEWGGYNFYTYNLEVFLAQQVYLNTATNEQRMVLLSNLFEKQEVRKNKRGYGGTEGPTFAMSRVLFCDDYKPLIDSMAQNPTIKALVELGFLMADSAEVIETKRTIFELTNDYLNELKNTE